jgi:hypothetical protein
MKSGIFILFWVISWNAFAQQPGFTAGLEAGIGFAAPVYVYDTASTQFAQIEDGIPVASLTGGLYLMYTLNRYISFKTGLYYCGTKLRSVYTYYPDINPYPGIHSDKYYASGFKVPMLIRVSYGKMLKYFLDFGPYLNFNNDRYESYYLDSTRKTVLAESGKRRFFSIGGLSTGLGLSYQVKENVFLSAEGMYNFNLSPATSKGGAVGEFNLLIGIGYEFWITGASGDNKGDIFVR